MTTNGSGISDAPANNLLRALRSDDFALLGPHLRQGSVRAGQILYEPGDDVRHVYFPADRTLLAFRVVLDDGRAVETALVGREGAMAGIVSQGRLPSYSRAEVLHDGPLLRMDVDRLEEAKLKSLSVRHLFARYADCLMAQVFQSVACNAAHSIEQRAAKWLVSAMERTSESRVPLTQEQLANMLGVGRSYVSRVIQSLKARRLIETHRGGLTIADPEGLRALACGCQDSVRRHFDEVLKGVYPDEPITDLRSDAVVPARSPYSSRV
jgi:CRP-like cAMP-binding protein